jgi:peptide deformylase
MKYYVTNTKCRGIARPIDHIKELMALRQALKDDPYAAALASPQIGHNISAFAIRSAELPMDIRANDPVTLMLNPRLLSTSLARNTAPEACRSADAYNIPKLDRNVPVRRFNVIELLYLTENRTEVQTTLAGYTARIIQHEIDHLNGLSIYR